jgi:2-polyprenyl-3-methyl-5-hydroxy-6-metoxy-1,4-benzoquinol methylase
MDCLLCGSDNFSQVFSYTTADKYEKWCRLNGMIRFWNKCSRCGMYQAWHSYDPDELAPVYKEGYRNAGFRGETVEEVFNKILRLPKEESENLYRAEWFKNHIGFGNGTVLDIGSGFGIWPWTLDSMSWKVQCIEPNKESCAFINDSLGIPCHLGFFSHGLDQLWDVVSVVHVLEHIKNIGTFLDKIYDALRSDGRLFIEVPDACEFSYLPKEHDEFNSCHLYFFDLSTLSRLLERHKFSIMDAHRVHYEKRNLSRIMALCRKD